MAAVPNIWTCRSELRAASQGCDKVARKTSQANLPTLWRFIHTGAEKQKITH